MASRHLLDKRALRVKVAHVHYRWGNMINYQIIRYDRRQINKVITRLGKINQVITRLGKDGFRIDLAGFFVYYGTDR